MVRLLHPEESPIPRYQQSSQMQELAQDEIRRSRRVGRHCNAVGTYSHLFSVVVVVDWMMVIAKEVQTGRVGINYSVGCRHVTRLISS
jgi:hypothetical protein